MADVGPASGQPDATRRSPHGDGVLRRDPVHRRAAPLPGTRWRSRSPGRPLARPGLGYRADRGTTAAGRPLHPVRELDRRRPRREPGGDRRDHGPHAAYPRRSRPARLRGRRDPADANGRSGHLVGGRGSAPRVPPRARCGGPARDGPTGAPALPRRAVPAAVRVHRGAAAPDPSGPGRRARAADRPLRVSA